MTVTGRPPRVPARFAERRGPAVGATTTRCVDEERKTESEVADVVARTLLTSASSAVRAGGQPLRRGDE